MKVWYIDAVLAFMGTIAIHNYFCDRGRILSINLL
jgi:hypothetical protein